MNKLSSFLLLFFSLILIPTHTIGAVKVVQCEDKEGNISFQTTCPPGQKQIGEKKLSTASGSPGKKTPNNINALLYIGGEDCTMCEDVEEFLKTRSIKITIKDATSDTELQKELKELVGSLTVPATKIGDTVITGYKRNELKAALEAEGYEEESEESNP